MGDHELAARGDVGAILQSIAAELDRDPVIKSAHTRRGYWRYLTTFETWRDGRPLTRGLVGEYLAQRQRAGKSPATINRALAAIRWWARRVAELARDQPLPEEPPARERWLAQRAEIVEQAGRVAEIKDVKGTRPPKGRDVAEGEIRALLEVCRADPTAAGVRDGALIALACATGLRRSELAGLRLEDLQRLGAEEVELGIQGKGDKPRQVSVANGAYLWLADWLALRGTEPGPLFYAINRGGAIQRGHGVSDEALAQMLAKRRQAAGVQALTWHDFRRSFAGDLLDNGFDLATVQQLMGHASPVTTANYDRRDKTTRRKAIRSLHVPYWGRSS